MTKKDSLAALASLTPYQQRRFVARDADLRDPAAVSALYERLLARKINSRRDLKAWIIDRSELDAALDQAGSILYIHMTSQTDHPRYARDYQDFVQKVTPVIKPLSHQLDRKYLSAELRFRIDRRRYEVYRRSIRTEVDLFRDDNVALETQVSLYAQKYQALCGAMTVSFQGRERTLPEMTVFLRDPQRTVREKAWRAVAERRLRDRDRLKTLFDKMRTRRHRLAANAGYRRFAEYQFRVFQRFDYTPEDCRKYHLAVEKVVIPVWERIIKRRRKLMGLVKLRPWDMEVDPLGRPPLRPFERPQDLVDGVRRIFRRIDPQFGRQFSGMGRRNLLDLFTRKGKAPGGYQTTLAEARLPFIFMNAAGLDDDVRTLLHEGGHAFHSLACAHDPLFQYRHAPLEFCEVASMGMELLGGEHLDVFYGPEDRERSRRDYLEDVVRTLVWVATVDAFQHWIYEHPRQTSGQRAAAWKRIYRRFGGDLIDWDGLERFRESLWHRQLHIFEYPFYYIEYGIAQLGALQIWQHAQENFKDTLSRFKAALVIGGSRPLPELFKAAGLKFDFSEKTIRPLVDGIEKELDL